MLFAYACKGERVFLTQRRCNVVVEDRGEWPILHPLLRVLNFNLELYELVGGREKKNRSIKVDEASRLIYVVNPCRLVSLRKTFSVSESCLIQGVPLVDPSCAIFES